VRSFTEAYLSDIDNIVPLENTSHSNKNKKIKIKERISDESEWYFQMVQCCQCQINSKRTQPRDERISEITYSGGVAKCP